jgi:hypothetical protein
MWPKYPALVGILPRSIRAVIANRSSLSSIMIFSNERTQGEEDHKGLDFLASSDRSALCEQ